MSDLETFQHTTTKPGHCAMFELASAIRILFVFGQINYSHSAE